MIDPTIPLLEAELARLRPIIERIMTQHWDMSMCLCWVCEEGRAAGCRPRSHHLLHNDPAERRTQVVVPWGGTDG